MAGDTNIKKLLMVIQVFVIFTFLPLSLACFLRDFVSCSALTIFSRSFFENIGNDKYIIVTPRLYICISISTI